MGGQMGTVRGKQRDQLQETGTASQPSRPPLARKWIWFRNERGARSQAKEEFDGLPAVGRAGLADVIKRYRDGQSRRSDVGSLGDGLLELRDSSMNVQFRVLFIPWGPHWVALTAFCKNQQKTPRTALKRARTRARQWRKVYGEEPRD
jgi:phage-related protein